MKVLFPYIRLFRKQWLMMLVGILLTIITLFAGIGLLSLSGWFLSATAVAGLSVVTAQAFNFFTPAGGVRFLSISRTASRYGERLATHEATFKILTDLRVWVWQKLFPLSASNLQSIRQGDMLNRLVADIDTLDHLYLRLLTPLTASLLTIVGLYFFIAWFDPTLANMLGGMLFVAWLVLPLAFYILGHKAGRDIVESKRNYRIKLLEYIQGQAELTLFGANHRYRQLLDGTEQQFFGSQNAMAKITALSQSLLVLISGAALLTMLYFASFAVGSNNTPGPLYALMVFAAMACVEMLMPLAGAFQHLSSCVLAAERLNQITMQHADIHFPLNNDNQITKGELSIANLSFGYSSSDCSNLDDVNADDLNSESQQLVLNQLSLSIMAGSKVAILGKTGCGKSTLLSLITRQWSPNSGQILIDNKPVEEYCESALRRGISILSQRVYLFSGTLRDNLAIALMPNELFDNKQIDQKILSILEQVGLSVLLKGDNPLELWLGEGGRQLSGGELRRIGIARVLLRDAPLLLLDEPTEGLDKQTERDILSLLLNFSQDKTLVMISHRLTAMWQMDAIYQLTDNGILIRKR